ncbi:MAG: HisA/HisF-related TIM barrel protein [Thermoplasmata archaeon]
MGTPDANLSTASGNPISGPVLIPNLYLDSGQIVEADAGQFEPVLDDAGKPVDLFEVSDRLVAKFQRFCVVDLEGVRRNRPQLDYLQELSRSGELWVDAGIRTGDQVIDILVTGARRTVLSTAYLLGAKQLRRAWRLSTEILFAVETEGAVVRSRGNDWDGMPAAEAVGNARTAGIVDVIVRSRSGPVDWCLVRQLATQGPTWVDGASGSSLPFQLSSAQAVGGFFDPPRALLIGSEEHS